MARRGDGQCNHAIASRGSWLDPGGRRIWRAGSRGWLMTLGHVACYEDGVVGKKAGKWRRDRGEEGEGGDRVKRWEGGRRTGMDGRTEAGQEGSRMPSLDCVAVFHKCQCCLLLRALEPSNHFSNPLHGRNPERVQAHPCPTCHTHRPQIPPPAPSQRHRSNAPFHCHCHHLPINHSGSTL